MKIVILDGYTLNPGDLSWQAFMELGDVTIYDRTPPELVVERAAGAKMVFTNKTPLRADTIAALPQLQYIGVLATGYDVIDVQEANKHHITVTNTPAYGTDSVAQMVFALLHELCQHVGHHSHSVRQGEWVTSKDWCYWHTPLTELAGKTIGIIGLGRIGLRTAEIALAYGMNVIASASRSRDNGNPTNSDQRIKRVELAELFIQSDVISLHCPLTPGTLEIINAETLSQMKPSAFLINTSRGKLLNEIDVAAALNQGVIAGAGLDVLSTEPPAADNPLLTAQRCIITPHISWASIEARTRLLDIAVENAKSFIAGKPINLVK